MARSRVMRYPTTITSSTIEFCSAARISTGTVHQYGASADGTICAHGYCHIVQINVPVHVGGVMVHPGDLLHGDRNGVTTIPNEIASAVAQACPELMAAEAVVLDYLKAGKLDASAPVTNETLFAAGVVSKARDGVKILGVGELKAKLTFQVAGASKSAVEAIEKVGGSVTLLGAVAQA